MNPALGKYQIATASEIAGLKSNKREGFVSHTTAGPLRVLVLADHLAMRYGPVHGVTTYFTNVLPALQRDGIKLTVCFMAPRHPIAAELESRGIHPIFLARSKWDIRAIRDVARLVRERKPHIMHISGLKSKLIGRIIAKWNNCYAIVHLHDMLPPGRVVGFLERLVAPLTDIAIGVSGAVCDYAVQEYGISRKRTRALHNGIDVEMFANPRPDASSCLRRELSLDDNSLIIGMVGRLAPEKGHEYAIRSMPKILKQVPQAVLAIVGEGSTSEACQDLARSLGVSSSVRFVGQRNDIPDVLAAVDVLVMPSLLEGLGFAAMEALSAGKPVVAFPTGGIPEIVADGHNGILVPRGDIEALAAALVRVLREPKLAAQLGQQGREDAKHFTVERHVEQLEQLYADVVENRC